MLSLELPHLEQYEVHEGSLVYSSKGGVLFNKAGSTIFAIPKKINLPLELRCSYDKYAKKEYLLAKHMGPDVIVHMEYMAYKNVLLSKLKSIDVLRDITNLSFVYATGIVPRPNEKFDDFFEDLSKCKVMPHFNYAFDEGFTSIYALYGYINCPDLYGGDLVKLYTRHLVLNEHDMYPIARVQGMRSGVEFIEKRWEAREVFLDFEDKDFQGPIPLVEAVLFGSVDDVGNILDRYDHLVDCDKAPELMAKLYEVMPLACRYGGEDKVKRIVQHQFFEQNKIEIDLNLDGQQEQVEVYDIGHLTSFMHHTLDANEFKNEAIGDTGEVRNLKPLDPKERIEALGHWLAYLRDEETAEEMQYFFACTIECREIESRLSDEISENEFFRLIKKILFRKEYHCAFKFLLERKPDDAVAFVKMMNSKLTVPLFFGELALTLFDVRPDYIPKLLEFVFVEKSGAGMLTIKALERNDIGLIWSLLDADVSDSGYHEIATRCAEAGYPELAAAALQKKRQTYDERGPRYDDLFTDLDL